MIATPDHDPFAILLSLKERFRPDGSHDAIDPSRVTPTVGPYWVTGVQPADERPRCECGDLLTIVSYRGRCNECWKGGDFAAGVVTKPQP